MCSESYDPQQPDRSSREQEACREVTDLLAYYLPQIGPGDIHDTMRICRVRVSLLAERRFGDGWARTPVSHLHDPDGVALCLADDGGNPGDPSNELCEICVAALDALLELRSLS